MSVDTEEKFIKIKASHSKTLYPSAGIRSDGKNWGIVSWNILEVEQGNPTMSVYGEVTFTGEYTDGIDPNSAYVLLGKEVEHPKYGVQYQLVYYNKDIDFSNQKNQRAFLRTFLSEGQMDELFAVCDDPLQVIADHDIETLKKAKGIGDYISNCIIERFEASKDMSTVYLELDKVGFSPNFISKLIEKYKAPQKVIDIVKNNPYQLVKDIKGVGFFTADKVALRSGYKTYDTKRIKSYILWYLDAQGEEGHSWVSAGELMGSLYEDLGGKQSLIVEDEDGNLVNNVGKAIKELQDEELVRVEEGDTKSGRRVYLMSFWNLEKDIAYHLKRLLQGNNYFVANDFEEKIKRAEEKQGFQFTQEQIDGIKLGIEKQVCVISGLAGSGKSSLVTGILSVLDEYTFAQCALSGKAAARLQEVTGKEGFTIHRLLGYTGGCGFSYGEDNPLPYDIIILDEVSMVGGEIFLDLIRAIPTGSKLLMLGDMGQLESIGSLNLAADMINSKEIPTVELKEVHRQAKASGILTTAYNVRNGIQLYQDTDYEGVEIRGELKDMVLDIRNEKDDDRKDTIAYFEKYFNSSLVNGDIEKIQIISPVKERGDACVHNLNLDIQKLINPVDLNESRPRIYVQKMKDASGNDRSFWIQEGDKVMCIKNNYKVFDTSGAQTAMYNGWTGVVTSIDYENAIVDFDLGDAPIILKHKEVKEHLILGYACTTHKYQGSGCPVIIGVIDYSTPPMMLCQQQIYTLLTRAKKLCVLVAQTKALRRSIDTNFVSTKRTFLPEFLKQEYRQLREQYNVLHRKEDEERRALIRQLKDWKEKDEVQEE